MDKWARTRWAWDECACEAMGGRRAAQAEHFSPRLCRVCPSVPALPLQDKKKKGAEPVQAQQPNSANADKKAAKKAVRTAVPSTAQEIPQTPQLSVRGISLTRTPKQPINPTT